MKENSCTHNFCVTPPQMPSHSPDHPTNHGVGFTASLKVLKHSAVRRSGIAVGLQGSEQILITAFESRTLLYIVRSKNYNASNPFAEESVSMSAIVGESHRREFYCEFLLLGNVRTRSKTKVAWILIKRKNGVKMISVKSLQAGSCCRSIIEASFFGSVSTIN